MASVRVVLKTSSRQQINKEKVVLNKTLEQMDLVDNFWAFHPKAAEYTYFSSAHGMFSGIHHMLGQKTSPNKFKKIEIISSIFSDQSAMELEINYKKITGKHTKTWKPNNMLLNNEWVNNKIKEKSKDTLKQIKMRTQQSKICGTLGKQS